MHRKTVIQEMGEYVLFYLISMLSSNQASKTQPIRFIVTKGRSGYVGHCYPKEHSGYVTQVKYLAYSYVVILL